MELSILAYKFFEQNGGSFGLLIDNIPLAQQVDYEESLIPYRITDKGIPTFPPYQNPPKINEKIVAVCGGGEYGCGCITCRVTVENDFVISSGCKKTNYSRVIYKNFKFAKENFRGVENQITIDAKKIKESLDSKIS